MTTVTLDTTRARQKVREVTAWERLKVNRDWLGFWFMLPACGFLVFFLAYPLGLGVWMSFTDARIGRGGKYIGSENYEWLLGAVADWIDWFSKLADSGASALPGDGIFWLSVFNTLLYT